MAFSLSKFIKVFNKVFNPWKPYNNHINHLFNTNPDIVEKMRDGYREVGIPIAYSFHHNPPQGVTLDLVKEGVIELRYDPNNQIPQGSSIVNNGQISKGYCFPYQECFDTQSLHTVPFKGADYNFGEKPKNNNQVDSYNIHSKIFKNVKQFSNMEENTIPVPLDLVDKVMQLSNDKKNDEIRTLINI